MSDNCCAIDTEKPLVRGMKKVLWIVFGINAVMFVVEFTLGYHKGSTALMADSLDMLGDAFVYGVSLAVVTKSNRAKARVSLLKGVVMTILALFVVYELILKVLDPVVINGQVVSAIGVLALLANGTCLWLLARHRLADINMRSAWVCSRNDMAANIGVIIAGLLVVYGGSSWPDVAIGGLIAVLVLVSSVRVMLDSRQAMRQAEEKRGGTDYQEEREKD